MMGLLNPGDEVLVPDPVWLHYFYCAQMAGAVPISVPTREENGFIPSIDDFKALITDDVKTVIIGTGYNGLASLTPKAKELFDQIRAKGIQVQVMPTSDAVELFNGSSKKGLLVCFHLNC